ncbi:MAG TPA: SIMPL domain-containing protein [Victivallales bacterium]|nr:SIMPL domain-containing protein [Victivallales bacterium]
MKNSKLILIVFFASATLLFASYMLARPWISLRKIDTLQVKGYAELQVKSDSSAMTVTIKNVAKTLADAYDLCSTQMNEVKALASSILGKHEISDLNTEVDEICKLDDKGNKTNFVDNYAVKRAIRIESSNVESMKKLAASINDLNGKGVMALIEGPSFFVNNLEATKVNLVRQATENGKARAQEMAKSAGYSLGRLVSARQGVIQITKMNSSDTSDWGVYDTQTIEKVAKLAVSLEFEIE